MSYLNNCLSFNEGATTKVTGYSFDLLIELPVSVPFNNLKIIFKGDNLMEPILIPDPKGAILHVETIIQLPCAASVIIEGISETNTGTVYSFCFGCTSAKLACSNQLECDIKNTNFKIEDHTVFIRYLSPGTAFLFRPTRKTLSVLFNGSDFRVTPGTYKGIPGLLIDGSTPGTIILGSGGKLFLYSLCFGCPAIPSITN